MNFDRIEQAIRDKELMADNSRCQSVSQGRDRRPVPSCWD